MVLGVASAEMEDGIVDCHEQRVEEDHAAPYHEDHVEQGHMNHVDPEYEVVYQIGATDFELEGD